MNNIEHFILPEHTNNLYKNEAISSISLTKEVADKINELVDRYNELSNWNYEKHQEQDGKIRKGIIYMKDNLINTLNDLMELLLKNGFIDDRIELYSKTLKEQLDNAISGLTADSEVIDSRVDYTGKVDKTLGEGLRRQFEELFSQMVNENLFKLKNLDYGYLQNDGKLTAKQSTYAVASSEDVKRFELTSDFIEVEPNTTYYLKQYYLNENVDKAWFRIVSYDANKNVIGSIDREYTEFTFTSGDNVKYVRISYRSFLTGIVKFERSTYPTPLIESFTGEINSLNDFIINGFVEGKTGILAREQSFVERMSTPIEVDAGDVFNMFAWGVYDSWYRITYYDKNYIVVSDTALYFNNITQKAFEIPENAKYMRVSIRSKGMSMFALIKDTNEQYPVLLEKFNGYLMNKPNLITPLKSIAHRGYCTEAPENTIHAFKLAVEKGFKYIEGDVVMTSDGVPVLHHDDTIDRTSNSTGNVREFTYKELYALDFGYKNLFEDKFSGTKIMTLNEFMSFCRKTGVHPYIELKSGIDADGIKKCVDIVKSYGMLNNCTWISFSKTELLNVLENCPYARIGYVYDKITEDVITNTLNLKTPFNDVFLDTNYNYLTDKAVKMCADINVPVEVYTVNNERAILTLNSYVSGVTSDCLIADEVYKSNELEDITQFKNNSYSNALKGSETGIYNSMSDVSPISHELNIKLTSDTLADFSNVTVTRYGKNLINISNMTFTEYINGALNYDYIDTSILKGNTLCFQFYADFSKTIESTARVSARVLCYDVNKKVLPTVFYGITNYKKNQITSVVFTIPDDIAFITMGVQLFFDDTKPAQEGSTITLKDFQLSVGEDISNFEPYTSATQTIQAEADGTVKGCFSLYPSTTLITNNANVIINTEYNRDINKAFAELQNAILSLGGNF